MMALTPTPAGRDVVLTWETAQGPVHLTCRLIHDAGRVQLAGLDIAGFAAGGQMPPVELTHAVLRSLQAGRIAAEAQAQLVEHLQQESRSRGLSPSHRREARSRLDLLSGPQSPRPRGGRPVSEQLVKVAALFTQARDAGGESARTPSLFVHHALAAEGSDITLSAVRGQIHRARLKGLIPATEDVDSGRAPR